MDMTRNAVRQMVKRTTHSWPIAGQPTPPPSPVPLPSSPSSPALSRAPSPSPLPPPSSDSVQSHSTQPAEYVFDSFTIGTIRRYVHKKFLSKDTFIITILTRELKKEGILPEGTWETLFWRVLHKMGFRYKTTQRKMYARKESLDIVCKRIHALRALKQSREVGRQVVYLDETWFTTRMSHNKEWVDTTQPSTTTTYSRQVPPGDGERFVVVAAGTSKGFIEDSFLCYTAKNSSGDYHGEMNAELFER
ncbi:uncharacterized protein LOC135221417 [Macrobrachium nipponense]|uniref:uncharacterized protein LOC135221417 n=1 Tax=Macrobrachium nipponense TaxID=159736 RepID=UPI0030C7D19F